MINFYATQTKLSVKKPIWGDFPGGPVVKNLPCNAGDTGLISDWGTKIPHAMQPRNSICWTIRIYCLNICHGKNKIFKNLCE